MVKNKKKFLIGLTGFFLFFCVFSFWAQPVGHHNTALEWADDLFNQLAKKSAYSISLVPEKAKKFRGVVVDLAIDPRWPGADRQVAAMIGANGIAATVIGDGRVRVKGDLERLSLAASRDADFLFKGEEPELHKKYGMSGKEVIYYWWTTFDDLIRRYVQLNRASEADFAKFIASRVLEPSYNFAGIESKSISDHIGMVILLLAFYLLLTVWYGLSILYLFEGLGIEATKRTEKKEV